MVKIEGRLAKNSSPKIRLKLRHEPGVSSVEMLVQILGRGRSLRRTGFLRCILSTNLECSEGSMSKTLERLSDMVLDVSANLCSQT